jgi:DNA topoisomerase-1
VAIPKAPDGHSWKGVAHNNKVTWLAYWNDNVNGDFKYVFLSAASRFKGESDMKKYTKAQKLKGFIDKVRSDYNSDLLSSSVVARQRAVAMYLIDKLALRVGNEKDTSEVADTVGCCSLRVEHLKFLDNNEVQFDFLGKDSMRYFNQVALPEVVYKEMKSFCSGKKPTDDVFNKLTTSSLNQHLGTIMPHLTAKVFRTYNASITLQQELEKPSDGGPGITVDDTVNDKVLYYNRANRQVAILCNHQRSVPKQFDNQMEKMKEKLDDLEAEEAALQAALKGKAPKKQSKGKTPFKIPQDKKAIKTALQRLEGKIANERTKIRLKDDTKTVALGTSKINYMDPRITIAWCKRFEVPIEKVFGGSLLQKFPWAMEVTTDWQF